MTLTPEATIAIIALVAALPPSAIIVWRWLRRLLVQSRRILDHEGAYCAYRASWPQSLASSMLIHTIKKESELGLYLPRASLPAIPEPLLKGQLTGLPRPGAGGAQRWAGSTTMLVTVEQRELHYVGIHG